MRQPIQLIFRYILFTILVVIILPPPLQAINCHKMVSDFLSAQPISLKSIMMSVLSFYKSPPQKNPEWLAKLKPGKFVSPYVRAKSIHIKNTEARGYLTRQNISFSETKYFSDARRISPIEPILTRELYEGRVKGEPEAFNKSTFFIIDHIPTHHRPGHSTMPALEHPEMPKRLALLHQWGYRLVIDSNIDIIGVRGYMQAPRFFTHREKASIMLHTKSSWDVFEHEFFHLIFWRFLSQHLTQNKQVENSLDPTQLIQKIRNDPDFKKVKNFLPPPLLSKLERLISYQLPRTALNESLAVETQRLVLAGSQTSLPERSIRYALKHRIYGLVRLADRKALSKVEQLTFFQSWIEYLLLKEEVFSRKVLERILDICLKKGDCGETALALSKAYRFLANSHPQMLEHFRNNPNQALQELPSLQTKFPQELLPKSLWYD